MDNFRTDLADERRELFKKANNIENEIDGIETEQSKEEGFTITRVKIINKNGEKALQKPIGTYITIDIEKIKSADEEHIR